MRNEHSAKISRIVWRQLKKMIIKSDIQSKLELIRFQNSIKIMYDTTKQTYRHELTLTKGSALWYMYLYYVVMWCDGKTWIMEFSFHTLNLFPLVAASSDDAEEREKKVTSWKTSTHAHCLARLYQYLRSWVGEGRVDMIWKKRTRFCYFDVENAL